MAIPSALRDPDDDVATGLHVRLPGPVISPWPSTRKLVPRASQNVFLLPPKPSDPPPPWATRAPRVIRARRSIMPWVVFAMCFGITFGIARDARVRAELAADLRATLAALYSLVS